VLMLTGLEDQDYIDAVIVAGANWLHLQKNNAPVHPVCCRRSPGWADFRVHTQQGSEPDHRWSSSRTI
jgi:hypothetical protein